MPRMSPLLSTLALVLLSATARGDASATITLWPATPPSAPAVTPDLRATGERVYRGACIGCHGEKGFGDGKEVLNQTSAPNDFTTGQYAIRSTPAGTLPLDADLFGSIRRGLKPAADMPAFAFLSDREVWAVVAYIKGLSPRFAAEKPGAPVMPPGGKAGNVEAGRGVFLGAGACFVCHGMTGRGDGPAGLGLAYVSGHRQGRPVRPPDFTKAADFKGGHRPEDIFRTISTGLDGTPMPSFGTSLTTDQRRNLTAFVLSLSSDQEEHAAKGVAP